MTDRTGDRAKQSDEVEGETSDRAEPGRNRSSHLPLARIYASQVSTGKCNRPTVHDQPSARQEARVQGSDRPGRNSLWVPSAFNSWVVNRATRLDSTRLGATRRDSTRSRSSRVPDEERSRTCQGHRIGGYALLLVREVDSRCLFPTERVGGYIRYSDRVPRWILSGNVATFVEKIFHDVIRVFDHFAQKWVRHDRSKTASLLNCSYIKRFIIISIPQGDLEPTPDSLST